MAIPCGKMLYCRGSLHKSVVLQNRKELTLNFLHIHLTCMFSVMICKKYDESTKKEIILRI